MGKGEKKLPLVVEVSVIIRCENCCEWDESWQDRTESKRGYCNLHDMMTPKDWWCKDGEDGID